MTNRERFFEAFAHEAHVVMGRRLVKFTLRHRFWLEVFDSPVVNGGELRLVDLELAARVCAIPYALLDEAVPRLVVRRAGRWGQVKFLLRTMRGNTREEYAALLAYLMDHGCPPETFEAGQVQGEDDGPPPRPGARRNDPDRFSTLPGVLSLVTGLMKRTTWEPDVVWSLGPGEAEWYLAGVLLHDGVDVAIKTPSDEEFEEGLRRERAAAAAAKVTSDGECEAADVSAEAGSVVSVR